MSSVTQEYIWDVFPRRKTRLRSRRSMLRVASRHLGEHNGDNKLVNARAVLMYSGIGLTATELDKVNEILLANEPDPDHEWREGEVRKQLQVLARIDRAFHSSRHAKRACSITGEECQVWFHDRNGVTFWHGDLLQRRRMHRLARRIYEQRITEE